MIFLASTIAVPAGLFIFALLGILFAFITFLEGGKNHYPRNNNQPYHPEYEHRQDYYPYQNSQMPRQHWATQQPDYELRPRRQNPVGTLLAILALGAILALFFMMQSNKVPDKKEQQQDSSTKAAVMDDFGITQLETPTSMPYYYDNELGYKDSPYWDNEYEYDEYKPPVIYKKVTPEIAWVARFTVQTGFFIVADNAINETNHLSQSFPNHRVWIETSVNDLAQKGYFVFVGEFANEATAKAFRTQLKQQGFGKGMIVPLAIP